MCTYLWRLTRGMIGAHTSLSDRYTESAAVFTLFCDVPANTRRCHLAQCWVIVGAASKTITVGAAPKTMVQHVTNVSCLLRCCPVLAQSVAFIQFPSVWFRSPVWQGGGPGAVVKHVKASSLESRRSRVRSPLWHSSF